MPKKTVSVDIWGTCTTRDIFNMGDGDKYGVFAGYDKEKNITKNQYVVKNYYEQCSFVSSVKIHHGPKINLADFSNIEQKTRDFIKKCIQCECNGSVLELLKKNHSDWLIVDFRYLIYGLHEFGYADNRKDLLCSRAAGWYEAILKNKKIEYSMRKVSYYDYFPDLDKFIKQITTIYGSNIILNSLKESEYYLDENGEVLYSKNESVNNELIIKIENHFLKKTSCFVINVPYNVCTDYLHTWGKWDSVHYISEYYEYALKAIDLIISKSNDLYVNMNKLYYDTCSIIAEILVGKKLSLNNTVRRIELLLCQKKYSESSKLIDYLVENNYPIGLIYKSKKYRLGWGVEKDPYKSLDILSKANCKSTSLLYEKIEVLRDIGTEDSYKSMVMMLSALVESQDAHATAVLGWAYHRGKGVNRDLKKAENLLKKYPCSNEGWVKHELIDVLWEVNTESSLREMFDIAEELSNAGDPNSMARLGRAYLYGKGTIVNREAALFWMKKAMDLGIKWIGPEYEKTVKLNKSVD